MWANRGRDVQRKLHFGECFFLINDRDCPNNGATLIADDVCLIFSYYDIQATAAFRIAKIGVRYGRSHKALVTGAVAHRAIARTGQRRNGAIPVGAADEVAIPNPNPTASGDGSGRILSSPKSSINHKSNPHFSR